MELGRKSVKEAYGSSKAEISPVLEPSEPHKGIKISLNRQSFMLAKPNPILA